MKFQNILQNERVCYKYTISNADAKDNVVIDVKGIKGDVQFYLSPNKLPTSNNYTHTFKTNATSETKFELTSAMRAEQKVESGVWFLCAMTQDTFSFYAIQEYLVKNTSQVLDFKKLLLSKYSLF